ncbi:MAG: NOL1/NOP2/sun family putative RNA methylase [Ignavibacteriaceae bacterium]|nr:NOL1/NOP2/sun family putative RNA methylase [Ignavibacteriaceae bacterium]
MNYISNEIINYINSIYGDVLAKSYSELINIQPAQYIRVNTTKITPENLRKALLNNYGITSEHINNYNNILKITDTQKLLGKTLEHILGYYYIQSLSSFIPPLVLNPSENDIVLDLCAAPGSKTTELGEIMKNRGTIVVNEIQSDRLKPLVYNIDRMNQMNSGVIHFKGEQLNTVYSNYFDKILVDAPCSGLGILQKKIEVNDWWNIQRVKRLSELQLKLLVSAIKMVKVGGEIVYSTCTLTVEENELIIDKILQKYPVEVVDFDPKIHYQEGIIFYNGQSLNTSLKKAKRILPWEVDSDGFFIIKLRKAGETEVPYKRELQLRDVKLLDSSDKRIKSLLINMQKEFEIEDSVLDLYRYVLKSSDIYFVNRDWVDPNPGFFERIGTRFGVFDKNKEIVLHTQAVQVLGNFISKNIIELNSSEELRIYLDGGTIKSFSLNKGQYLVKYQGFNLGTAVFTGQGLKSQFPRSRRTQEIYSEF